MATPKAYPTRETLEDFWLLRLQEAQARYRKTTERYRTLLQEQLDGTSHDPQGALAFARLEDSEALAEYSRILRAFTELTVHGRIPEEPCSDGSDSL